MNQTPEQSDQTPTPRNNNFLFGFFLTIGFGVLLAIAVQYPLNFNGGGLLDGFASEELENTDLDGLSNGPVFTTPPQIDEGIFLPAPGDQSGVEFDETQVIAVELIIEINDETGEATVTTPDGTVLEESEYPPGLAQSIEMLQSLNGFAPDSDGCANGKCTRPIGSLPSNELPDDVDTEDSP